MAHFAKVNENNIVEEVIVVDDNSASTEALGQEFIASIGLTGTWLQTSYNTLANKHRLGGTPFRKNYAGIGFTYDEIRDAFIAPKPDDCDDLNEETCTWIPPQPFASWTFSTSDGVWEAPTPYPTDGKSYLWDESVTAWVEIEVAP
jgi:hypothetical protein